MTTRKWAVVFVHVTALICSVIYSFNHSFSFCLFVCLFVYSTLFYAGNVQLCSRGGKI